MVATGSVGKLVGNLWRAHPYKVQTIAFSFSMRPWRKRLLIGTLSMAIKENELYSSLWGQLR